MRGTSAGIRSLDGRASAGGVAAAGAQRPPPAGGSSTTSPQVEPWLRDAHQAAGAREVTALVSKLDISLHRARREVAVTGAPDNAGAETEAGVADAANEGWMDGRVTVRVTSRTAATASDDELAEMVLEMLDETLRGGRDLNPRPPA